MSRILFYVLINPVSYLPLSVLYHFSDLLYFLGYRLAGYRKKVVRTNLKNAFPDKALSDIIEIERKFYHHFCDLIIESIRLFGISEAEALSRCRVRNPELLERFYREGRGIIISAGHFNNWEWAAVTVNPQISHQTVGVYLPLANDFINEKFQRSRRRFGLELIKKSETKSAFRKNTDRRVAYLFATDQSPTTSKKVFWTRFLNQETAVLFGTEKYAREYNLPVVYGRIIKVERGRYEMEFELVTDKPLETAHGDITEGHTRLLEKDILTHPHYWLWTHKRWKRKRK